MLDGADYFDNFDENVDAFFTQYVGWLLMCAAEKPTQQAFLEWRAIKPFEERLAHSSVNTKVLEPNCFSTAFYLKGILPYEQVVYANNDFKRVQEAIALMDEHDEPVDDSIMISFDTNNKLYHAAYILSGNPLVGFHRQGEGSSLESIVDIDHDVTKGFLIPCEGKNDYHHKFYTVNGNSLEEWAKKITAEYIPYWFA